MAGRTKQRGRNHSKHCRNASAFLQFFYGMKKDTLYLIEKVECVFFEVASGSQHARDDVPALSDSGEAFLTAVGFEEQVIRVYPKSL